MENLPAGMAEALEAQILKAWPRILDLLKTADLTEVRVDRLEAIKF